MFVAASLKDWENNKTLEDFNLHCFVCVLLALV